MDWKSRTELLIGSEGMEKLHQAHVLVAGLGGVGAIAAEMLVRAGIGWITIADNDTVHPSNRNRQIIALSSTEGHLKIDVMGSRLLDINPELKLIASKSYLIREAIPTILGTHYDYVVDAIDTLSPKLHLLIQSLERKYPVVSSMGAGGKFDPSQVQISDIADSYQCRLAHYLRKHLHRKGIYTGFKVVFSPEQVSKNTFQLTSGDKNKRSLVGTISYMPSIFGCFAASVVIRDLIERASVQNNQLTV
jgi:tRNA A37 threonylcarbamoyladenosine dehydratase